MNANGIMTTMPAAGPRLPDKTLAIAIPSHNRARMMERIVEEILPTCDALGVDVHVSDNGSTDETPSVCARLAGRSPRFHYRRLDPAIAIERNLMAAMAMSTAEYTWEVGDDDCVLPSALVEVARILAVRRPSAIIVGTSEVPSDDAIDLGSPILPQVAPLAPRAYGPLRVWRSALDLFAEKFYNLPLRTVVYRTAQELATDYARYYCTYHPHIGGLFDYLAAEEESRGEVDIVEIPEPCTVSLTVMHDKGKTSWSALYTELARVGFPRWFSLLPALYAPRIEAGLAYHRHIFREVLAREG
jgi:glycosyltransferase involved in cell wall biosynthesis